MRHHDDDPYLIIERQDSSIGSFLIGVAIGAGLAMLFAPRSGVETRRQLTRGARRARDEVRGRVTQTFEQARAEVEGRIESARQAIELKRTQVNRAVDAGRAAAQQARDDLERRIAETKAAYQAGAEVARAGGRGADADDEE